VPMPTYPILTFTRLCFPAFLRGVATRRGDCFPPSCAASSLCLRAI